MSTEQHSTEIQRYNILNDWIFIDFIIFTFRIMIKVEPINCEKTMEEELFFEIKRKNFERIKFFGAASLDDFLLALDP